MKIIMLAFSMLPFLVNSQECKLVRSVDPYTKEKTVSTGFIPLDGGKLTMDVNKTEIDLLFSVAGSDKCFSDGSTAAIFFVGTKFKQTQRNNGSMNCEGLFHFIFRNGATAPPLLRRLSTTKIEKILFTGNDKKETTVTLTPEQQQAVMDFAACVVKEAPLLTK